jgi:hypothetical protein
MRIEFSEYGVDVKYISSQILLYFFMNAHINGPYQNNHFTSKKFASVPSVIAHTQFLDSHIPLFTQESIRLKWERNMDDQKKKTQDMDTDIEKEINARIEAAKNHEDTPLGPWPNHHPVNQE